MLGIETWAGRMQGKCSRCPLYHSSPWVIYFYDQFPSFKGLVLVLIFLLLLLFCVSVRYFCFALGGAYFHKSLGYVWCQELNLGLPHAKLDL